MSTSEEKIVISHHCLARMSFMNPAPGELPTLKTPTECYQDSKGVMWFVDGDKEISVDFCPFCGKESRAHAEENHNAV